MTNTIDLIKKAKSAVPQISSLRSEERSLALLSMSQALLEYEHHILIENAKDLEEAKTSYSGSMLDRLRLDTDRLHDIAKAIVEVSKLDDPVGKVLDSIERPNGIRIQKIQVPLGVVGIIYESRPNVTADAAALCLKSGNTCVLRGGKEAYHSSVAIVEAMRSGLRSVGISDDAIQIVDDLSRDSAHVMMTANGYLDLLIPRGGKGLIDTIIREATVPCIQTGTGLNHIYVDRSANVDLACSIIENAKRSRPSVCNAVEVCLVHEEIAAHFLPLLEKALEATDERPKVELRVDTRAAEYISGIPAQEEDYDTEFLDYVLAVKVVRSTEEAIMHIANHSSHHSDAIISEDSFAQDLFTAAVDSAAVYVNASTRFTDGGEFGLGCEMGISTQKMHARGPIGLEELCTYKYVIHGNGQIR